MNSNLKGRRQHFIFFFHLYPSAHRRLSREVTSLCCLPACIWYVKVKTQGQTSWKSRLFARCDLHSRRHASPVLAVTGNPGMSPRWQPHYSDNSAGWKSFRCVPRDAGMCSVPRDALQNFLTPAAAGCEINFNCRATCRLQRGQRKRLPQRQTTAASAHKLLWFITMWLMHI